VKEPREGKIGRMVLMIALAAATVMLILAVGGLIGSVVQRNFRDESMHNRQPFHTAPQPPEGAQP
jgi:hypothetical protein